LRDNCWQYRKSGNKVKSWNWYNWLQNSLSGFCSLPVYHKIGVLVVNFNWIRWHRPGKRANAHPRVTTTRMNQAHFLR
jgi:hypothetical protein